MAEVVIVSETRSFLTHKVFSMAILSTGADAPAFSLESHLDTTVSLSDFAGSKNVLLVFYPLDFTPT